MEGPVTRKALVEIGAETRLVAILKLAILFATTLKLITGNTLLKHADGHKDFSFVRAVESVQALVVAVQVALVAGRIGTATATKLLPTGMHVHVAFEKGTP